MKATTTIRIDTEILEKAKQNNISISTATEIGIKKILGIQDEQDLRVEYYETTKNNSIAIQNLAKKIWELEAEIEKIKKIN